MPSVSKATARRLQHASGYLGLKMLVESLEELEAIEGTERLRPEVMAVRSDFYMEAKQWDLLLAVSRSLTRTSPDYKSGWINSAFALRQLNRAKEAKAVLLEAESLHGKKHGPLHYNLACCHCLLGEMSDARKRLRKACRADTKFKLAAIDEPDLKAMWDDIEKPK